MLRKIAKLINFKALMLMHPNLPLIYLKINPILCKLAFKIISSFT